MYLQSIKDNLNKEKMNENKFWGYLLDDGANDFNYGRDVLKDGTYET